MSDLIAVTGNLTSPPTRQSVSGGVTMVTFGLASTERRFDNGTWTDVHTNFYNVSVFRKLGEHAYASLEKGQRVIVAGKLKVRHWEASGRTGTSVDLEASSIGPDLMFGVATFVKDGRAAEVEGRSADGAGGTDGWAPGEASATPAEEASESGPAGGNAAAGADAPQLVAAGGWGAPAAADADTPF